jgi:gamma-glutamyl-gamma-aminobutyrate hydrolase PuuD
VHKPTVFIVGGGNGEYIRLFANMGWVVTSEYKEADAFLFTGGEDVSPELYGEKMHPNTYSSLYRDVIEKKMFNWAADHHLPMVGICRGGQFLNVMSGGKMYQHVTKHAGDYHNITDVDTGLVVYASSTHHQMMRPGNGGRLVAWAQQGGIREHCHEIGSENKAIISRIAGVEDQDVEVVFYPVTNSLCFQPHPEFRNESLSELRDYFFSLINRFFDLKA